MSLDQVGPPGMALPGLVEGCCVGRIYHRQSRIFFFFNDFLGQWQFQDPKMEVPYITFCGDILLYKPYIW